MVTQVNVGVGLGLNFKNAAVSNKFFAPENGMKCVIECGNFSSVNHPNRYNDKICLDEKSAMHPDIYLVEENSPFDKETINKEIVVNESCSGNNESIKPLQFKRGTLNFNIKLRKPKRGRKTEQRSEYFVEEENFGNYQHESDLHNIISNVKKTRNESNRLARSNSVKRIMVNSNTGIFSLIDTPRNSSSECQNFDKSNLLRQFHNSEETSTDLFILKNHFDIPTNPITYSQITIEGCEQVNKLTSHNGRTPEEILFPEIQFVNGLNPNLNLMAKLEDSHSKDAASSNNASKSTKIIYWLEGNIDKVSEPIYLSKQLRRTFSLNSQGNNSGSISNSSIDSNDRPHGLYFPNLKNEKASFSNVYLSWELVKERIEELEDEAQTRFINFYKTPTFKENPQPFKKIHFEMNTYRKKDHIVIPYNGVPFIFVGICIFSCHLGKYRKKNELLRGKISNSKKIGCPVILSVAKIARFPDFDISSLSIAAKEKALIELKNAWDLQTSRVRYYIEYCINEPKNTDHKFHEVNKQTTKFHEPVDPRILKHIHLLTKQGITSTRKMESLISSFIKNDLFNGVDVPSDRRRYNPTTRDIQYNIHKAKEEMKKERRNVAREQCVSLAKEIESNLQDINDEQLLLDIKDQLYSVAISLKDGIHSVDISSQHDVCSSESTVIKDSKGKKCKTRVLGPSIIVANDNIVTDRSTSGNAQIFDQDPLDFLFETPTDVGSSHTENGSFYLTHQDLTAGLNNQAEHFQSETNDDNTDGLLYLIPSGTFYQT